MVPIITKNTPHLRENGPILDLAIKPSMTTIEALNLEKKDIPWISVKALIDTGGSTTAISQKVIDKLHLKPKGSSKVYTSAKNDEVRNEYAVCIEFDTNAYIDTLKVIEANLEDHHIDCLLGRDVLSHCQLIYNGPKNEFALLLGEK